jgi:hypothetical protein
LKTAGRREFRPRMTPLIRCDAEACELWSTKAPRCAIAISDSSLRLLLPRCALPNGDMSAAWEVKVAVLACPPVLE